MVANYEHFDSDGRPTDRKHRNEIGAFQPFDNAVPKHWHVPSSPSHLFRPSSASFEKETEEQFDQMPWHLLAHHAALGWSQWSEWSACTRKCGGEGMQFQLRRCLDMYCSGPSSRHRICAEKSCPPNDRSFSTHSAVAIECALRSSPENELLPVTSIQNCSALHCVSRRNGTVHTFGMALRDGTKCHLSHGLPTVEAVCLHGKCRSVGCDGIVGSSARADQCGVCAGDGSSCADELFQWRDTGHFSPCDKTCGPNSIRVSVSVCVNIHTERVVPERMCADRVRPRPQVRRCEHIVCPPNHSMKPKIRHQWFAGEWADCSATCGTGQQRREVFCVERVDANVDRRVNAQHCLSSQKPVDVRKCSSEACPEWWADEWGACSASCGRGVRRRMVKCLRAGDEQFHEFHCSGKKPVLEQECWSGISCAGGMEEEPKQLMSYSEGPSAGGEDGGLTRPFFIVSAWGECSASCGPGIRSRLVECMAGAGGTLRLPDYECQDQQKPAQFQPCHLAPCPIKATPAQSAIRSLSKPFGGEPNRNGTSTVFRWEHGDWTKCSASCSGGKQRSPVICVDTIRRVTVAWTNCEDGAAAGQKPQELVRTCNRHACTPDWEIGPWSACSHACGGGLRTRRVRCVRTASGSSAATATLLVLPDGQCPGVRPGDEEPCGVVDCAPEWLAGNWGQCSASCGTDGEQRRVLRCVRRDALGDVRPLDDARCTDAQKPPSVRLCSLGPCPDSMETFSYSNQGVGGDGGGARFFAAAPTAMSFSLSKDEPLAEADDEAAAAETSSSERKHRKLTLKVGGFANLYEGTSVKVKCPLKGGGDRRRIVWTKDDRRVENSPRLKVSANGALRIFHATLSDAGVYACRTADGRAQGNVTLRFKPHQQHKAEKIPSTENRTKQQRKGIELLQRVRDSLTRLGPAGQALLQRMSSITDPGQIRLDYGTSDWAVCRQAQCGHGEGVQVRLLKCQLHVDGTATDALAVDENICEAFGVPRPAAARPCADERCPRWVTGPWSDCAASRCVRHGTALMRRDVRCAFRNGTLATAAALCDRRARPKLKRECENANCSAEWRPSVWGRCSKMCGDGGVQMRLLRCVWHGTRKPAGRNCEPAQRPITIRACESQHALVPCDDASSEEQEGMNIRTSTSNKNMIGRERTQSETVHGKHGRDRDAEESGGEKVPAEMKPKFVPKTSADGAIDGELLGEENEQETEEEKPTEGADLSKEKPVSSIWREEKPTVEEQKLFQDLFQKEKPIQNDPWEEKPFPTGWREEKMLQEAVLREEKPFSNAVREEKPFPTVWTEENPLLSKEKLAYDNGRRLRDVGGLAKASPANTGAGWQQRRRLYGWRPSAHFGAAAENGQMRRLLQNLPPSAALRQLCEDQSRFCDILRLFHTCDQPHVRARCCFSCRRFGNRTRNV
ncbi:hypothetical protein niasHT_023371 [Heterodera trifolii]|uniref:Ig-like domain-containing protein n=1 Tax=Heterodera trifolii TaxID=157864 RepID=A0ABD2K3V2_9BILA